MPAPLNLHPIVRGGTLLYAVPDVLAACGLELSAASLSAAEFQDAQHLATKEEICLLQAMHVQIDLGSLHDKYCGPVKVMGAGLMKGKAYFGQTGQTSPNKNSGYLTVTFDDGVRDSMKFSSMHRPLNDIYLIGGEVVCMMLKSGGGAVAAKAAHFDFFENSHRVLQQASDRALVWGYSVPGAEVTITMALPDGTGCMNSTITTDSSGVWHELLSTMSEPMQSCSFSFSAWCPNVVEEEEGLATDVNAKGKHAKKAGKKDRKKERNRLRALTAKLEVLESSNCAVSEAELARAKAEAEAEAEAEVELAVQAEEQAVLQQKVDRMKRASLLDHLHPSEQDKTGAAAAEAAMRIAGLFAQAPQEVDGESDGEFTDGEADADYDESAAAASANAAAGIAALIIDEDDSGTFEQISPLRNTAAPADWRDLLAKPQQQQLSRMPDQNSRYLI